MCRSGSSEQASGSACHASEEHHRVLQLSRLGDGAKLDVFETLDTSDRLHSVDRSNLLACQVSELERISGHAEHRKRPSGRSSATPRDSGVAFRADRTVVARTVEAAARAAARAAVDVAEVPPIRLLTRPRSLGARPRQFRVGTSLVHRSPAKLLGGQSCVPCDAAHSEGVDWIGSRDCENAVSVGHNDVLAFPNDLEPGFL